MSVIKNWIFPALVLGIFGTGCAVRESKPANNTNPQMNNATAAPEGSASAADVTSPNVTSTNETAVTAPAAPAKVIPLEVGDRVPAAEGQVKISEGSNHNTELDLEVKHMAQPDKLAANLNTYVLWEIPSSEQYGVPQNIGAFTVDQDASGHLHTLTPMHDFKLFLTAENSPTVTRPTGDKLMWTDVSR